MSRGGRILVGATFLCSLALGAPAIAQYDSPTRKPTRIETIGPPTSTVKPSRFTRPPGLGITGADVAGIAAMGLGSVGVGAVLVARSRRRVGRS